jgi:hypothetical protein
MAGNTYRDKRREVNAEPYSKFAASLPGKPQRKRDGTVNSRPESVDCDSARSEGVQQSVSFVRKRRGEKNPMLTHSGGCSNCWARTSETLNALLRLT